MRLTDQQQKAIVAAIRETFGEEAQTYLFGSRTDDTKFGGDIDLLVEVPQRAESFFPLKLRAVGRIQRNIGEQKIDLLVTDGSPEIEELLVVRNARRQGVLL